MDANELVDGLGATLLTVLTVLDSGDLERSENLRREVRDSVAAAVEQYQAFRERLLIRP